MLKELPAGFVYFCRALPRGQLEPVPCVIWGYLAAFCHQAAAQADLLYLADGIPDWAREAVALGCRYVLNSLWAEDPAWHESVF